ncbi:MAG: AraC family transcriptional regulator [Lachnospiraceae bacterium]|nr:AraC family transcriptional regulator [Lachnospiraceae bacterium]
MQQVQKYIAEHLTEELSREELAKMVYVSPDHLTRLFKKETGLPLNEYIISKRIQLAKQLLSETDLTIVEITEKAGFSYSSYFVKIFKKKTGMTPQQYRDENRKQR